MLTIIETNVGTFQIDIDSRTTRQDVATNIAHQLGHRGARVPNSSGNSTWAPFERQVERKVRPGEGLFSLRLPKFESYQPGMLNRPAAILRQPRCAQHQAKSLPKLHVGNAAARTRTVSAAPFRPNRLKFPRNTGGLRSQRIPQFESDHPSHAVGLAHVQKWRPQPPS